MKKIYLLIITVTLFVPACLGQVTVTNPTNTNPNLAATYTSLSLAVTALSGITAINGPVVITLNAGNPQTAPAGGYVIQFAATTTAVNNITIEGSNNTITSSAALTVGSLNDGIFKLIGADYITLQHFTMQENAANTNNVNATNTMTEWGVALLKASTTDGCQNNTIQNNTISLNRSYRNTFGIYGNVRHTATAITATTDISSVAGSNLGNKVYGNTISNVDYGVVFVGSGNVSFMDTGNDIGGNAASTGNIITNWGATTAALSGYSNVTTSSYCIYMNHQHNENVSYNTLTSALISNTTLPMGGIFKNHSLTAPAGVITSSITHNTITISSSDATSTMHAISNNTSPIPLSTFTLNITDNLILNCSIGGAASTSSFTGIINISSVGTLNIKDNIIRGTTSTAATGSFTGISSGGAVVNTIDITNNQLGNAAGGAVTYSVANTVTMNGISNTGGASTTTININNNALDGFNFVSSGQVFGIINNSPGGGVSAININNNQLGTVTGNLLSYSAAQSSALTGILSFGPANTVSIQGNDIRGIVHSVTGNASHTYINSGSVATSTGIVNNTFTNITANTTGSIFFMVRSGTMVSGAGFTCIGNSIVTGFNKTASGGTIYFLYSAGASVNGSTMTETGNNFSNVTASGAGIVGWNNQEGASTTNGPTKTITGNTFNNITCGGVTVMQLDGAAAITCTGNTISNINSSGTIFGIMHDVNNGQGIFNYSTNTISSLVSTGGDVDGFYCDATSAVPTLDFYNNNITGLSSSGTSADVHGVNVINSAATLNIYNNTINNLTVSGIGSPVVSGIFVLNGTTINIYSNKINTLQATGAISTTSPAVNGVLLSNGVTVTAYNNFVADLKAPNASLVDAIRGIAVTSTTALSNYYLYYNSVYINAISAGTNFGTSGIYHTSSATSTTARLTMVDNIIVNTSTAKGTGFTAAYRRSNTTLTNYFSGSDYNLFYAGTPGVKNLIFYDGTNSDQALATYKTRVSTRDANSISLMPSFTSATDLHLTSANCGIDGKGTPIGGYTDDIDLATRDVTTPDIGADEFTATYGPTLAGVAATAVCDDKTVSPSGTTYATSVCDLIARVVPSGTDPVGGKINVCVTLDASQLYFNGEPYVQRHFDLEPVTSNQTTTSATITLYFTNAEFVLYNTNNPVWPPLPTIAGGGNGDPNIANIKLTQFHGTPTGGLPTTTPGNYTGTRVLVPTSVVLNGSVWEVTANITGFSGFYVHTKLFNSPLAVSINYFTGTKQAGNHLLNWKVNCIGTPRVTMILERSADSRNFSEINSITADAARCNQPFDYTDADPLNGMNYYRLKMIDADGKTGYSSIVALLNAAKGFDIISIAPNPVTHGNFKLQVASAENSKMEIVIFDMQGRLVNRQSVAVIAGSNSIPIHIENLSAGTYTVYGRIGEDGSRVIRFVKQ